MQSQVGIVMGSKSDWPVMEHTSLTLDKLGVSHETNVISAHRAPDRVFEYAATAEQRGIKVIIAGAGCAAHLAGVIAAKTALPVLGVPMESPQLKGMDSLLSTVQMPAGIAVGTLAIGKAGAVNAALLAAQIIGLGEQEVMESVKRFRKEQTEKVLSNSDPRN